MGYEVSLKLHDLLLVALALVSEFTGTISGFGSSTFFVPGAVFLEAFRFVLALTAILHCFGNISKIVLFKKAIPRKLVFRLGLPSIIFAGIGAMLNSWVPTDILTRFLGVVLIIVSIFSFFKKSRQHQLSLRGAILFCGISGLMSGLVGTGGAIRGMALAALQIEKNSFIALSAAIDIVGDLLRAGIYVHEGYMDWSQWYYIPTLGIAAFAGSLAGKHALKRIDQSQFEKIVACFVFASGLAMIIS